MKTMRLAALAALVALGCGTAAAQSAPAHRARRRPGRARSDARAHLCGPHRVRVDLRQAVRHRREAQRRAAARALHETSEDGKTVTIKLRPNVKFHDGEKFDAEAAKFSLERHLTMQGSFRRPELAAIDTVEVVDPLTIKLKLKAPFSPLIAQLTDRAGMMVSPKAAKEAGDKFGLKPVCAGPYKFVERVQQDRIVVEKFADYWNKDNVHIDSITYLPIVDSTVRLANLQLRRARPARAAARDRHQGGDAPTPSSSSRPRSSSATRASPQCRQRREVEESARPARQGAPGARARDRSRGAQPGRVQRRVRAGQSVGQPRATPTIRRACRFRSATSPRPRR